MNYIITTYRFDKRGHLHGYAKIAYELGPALSCFEDAAAHLSPRGWTKAVLEGAAAKPIKVRTIAEHKPEHTVRVRVS